MCILVVLGTHMVVGQVIGGGQRLELSLYASASSISKSGLPQETVSQRRDYSVNHEQ